MTTDALAEIIHHQSRTNGKLELNWSDFAILVFLASANLFTSFEDAQHIKSALDFDVDTFNTWFDGDRAVFSAFS